MSENVAHSLPQVSVKNLTKTFVRRRHSEVHALNDVSIDVVDGELLVLLGPSGCGKTTLLRTIVGLEQPTSGQITLRGRVVSDAAKGVFVQPNHRDVGMVFQNYALWPHMTVRNNVAYPLKARGRRDRISAGRVDEVLEIVQCGHLADRYPPELSGGQQQRIALARALATNPALMLLDEPLSNLDALLRVELRAQLRHVHREVGYTGIYVTHDQEEALTLGTRIAVMEAGRVSQLATPAEIYDAPANEYVAHFLGLRNRLPVTVNGSGVPRVDGQALDGVGGTLAEGSYALRTRPKGVSARPAGTDGLASDQFSWLTGGTVIEALPGGDTVEYMLRLGDTELFAAMPARGTVLDPGANVDIGLDRSAIRLFDTNGQAVSL
ncbi:MAG: ABC transporter ATP-binding protein [Mycetocola sp.]